MTDTLQAIAYGLGAVLSLIVAYEQRREKARCAVAIVLALLAGAAAISRITHTGL